MWGARERAVLHLHMTGVHQDMLTRTRLCTHGQDAAWVTACSRLSCKPSQLLWLDSIARLICKADSM